MTPKVLLIGKNGQIGAELHRVLAPSSYLIALDRRELDLSNIAAIRRTIRDCCPRVIVNAAAYTAVDQAEKEETAARAINADAPAVMAEEARKIGAALVHYSTDYVFDGLKTDPYEEDDPPKPLNVYGKTKLEGEQAIRNSGALYLIFRTSWVYATHGKNFLLTVLRLATEREELRIVCDQNGAPTWSREIAAATARIVTEREGRKSSSSFEECSGTYHMTAAGQTTWYEFAKAILEEIADMPQNAAWLAAATRSRPVIAKQIHPIATEEYPTPARRPSYSVLSNRRLLQTFGIQLADWRAQLRSAVVDNQHSGK
ncbi:MAG TPA: dTDP-4-dehydrorhamnose reductase [Candidatus Acidoferrales bacterium]|nr:dTDP-4-dehydrorhamnose reductase [Candidatus Acidoferrales bacterium]